MNTLNVIQVGPDNLRKAGFFCRMSKAKSPGNQRKLAWLEPRFAEGMRMHLLGGGKRGFVEVMPGEHAWRPIHAAGWDVIHCIWVVGASKGHGLGNGLLDRALADARLAGRAGVCTVTREKNWAAPPSFFTAAGFKVVDEAKDRDGFVLLAKAFSKGTKAPQFAAHDWDKRLDRRRKGFVVYLADQCPYLADATACVRALATKLKVPFAVEQLRTAAEVRERAPSPYGVYGVVYDGKWVSYCYELPNKLAQRVEQLRTIA